MPKRISTDAKIEVADLDNLQNLINKAVTKSLAKYSQLKDELAEMKKDPKDIQYCITFHYRTHILFKIHT